MVTKKLLLIDANSLIHRAFHALPPFTSPTGEPTGALYGVSNILLKILKEEDPQFVAAAFDRKEPTFRKEMFKEYKAHRPPADETLIAQLIESHTLFETFGIKTIDMAGYEADDIIGTLVEKFKSDEELKIVILSGDLDGLQLVEDDRIVMKAFKKGVSETMIYDKEAVIERYGLEPEQLPDYKGLVGDTSDNIPGVKGVGPKTAESLLKEFGTLENLFAHITEKHPLAKKIMGFQDQALFSKKLATIYRETPITTALPELSFSSTPKENLIPYFEKLGFRSLLRRLQDEVSPVETTKHKISRTETKNIIVFVSPDDALKHAALLNSKNQKIALDWKAIIKTVSAQNLSTTMPIFDLGIAGWLLDQDQNDFSINALTRRFLHAETEETQNALQAAYLKLYSYFSEKIDEYKLEKIFTEIEMPLIPVLAAMETSGIAVNKEKLEKLQHTIEKELESLVKNIYEKTGGPFNINSPKQVASVIFEKLRVGGKKNKKTKTGQSKTGKDILESLKNEHPVIPLILSYRENFKILTSFVKPLLELRDASGRIHTTYLQTGAATGRLASAHPNLQNIPQESKWSILIRQSFESAPGKTFVSFDYSQLELRLLAHISSDKKLNNAFIEEKDIHQLTASQVFHKPLDQISPAERRLGKTLNFGVVYGMGARAFSETSGISFDEAKIFIEEYFADFPDVREWQKRAQEEARTFGYVTNANGRRRFFTNAGSLHPGLQSEIDRAAINTPIQSLGADILKSSMIRSFETLKNDSILHENAHLLLSIHDELLFEVRDDMLKKVTTLIKNIMEHIYPLSVPLNVDVKQGKNWGDMKSPSKT